VKPENVYVTSAGRFKLGDFDLLASQQVAHRADCEGDGRYLSREALEQGRGSSAADVFALGLSLFELVTGANLPSEGEMWNELRE
jgi:serine/threonine protein kinase